MKVMSQAKTSPPRRVPAWVQIPIYAALIGLLALVGLQMRRNGPLKAGPVGVGEMAPEFELTTFDGEQYSLADLRGQVVVVNFWASWCIPCKDEAPILNAAWERYRDQGVVFIGVDYVDTETEARLFMAQYGMAYPSGPDLGTRISQAYRVSGVPETYVVGRDGTLVSVKIGPLVSEAELEAMIEPFVAQ